MIPALLAGAIGAFAFALLIHAPMREAPFGGIAGAVAAGVFWLAGYYGASPTAAVFIAAIAVALASEIFARTRRAPASVFLTPGLIPLVPGLLAYHTMYALVSGQNLTGAEQGMQTLLWAGAVGVGIALVVTLVRMTVRGPSKEFTPPTANTRVPEEEEGGRPPRGQSR